MQYTTEFEEWWSVYPRKVKKLAAFQSFQRVVKRIGRENLPMLLEITRTFAASDVGRDPKFCPHATSWLNQGRWEDDQTDWNNTRKITLSDIDAAGDEWLRQRREAGL